MWCGVVGLQAALLSAPWGSAAEATVGQGHLDVGWESIKPHGHKFGLGRGAFAPILYFPLPQQKHGLVSMHALCL